MASNTQCLFPRSNPEPPPSFEQFLIVPIGKGSYGTVYRGINKRNFQKYAIKQILKKNHEKVIHYELQILYSIDCQYIVRLYDHFQTQTSVCLMMEYIEGKQLFDGIINKKIKLKDTEIAQIVYQLCLALHYLHTHKIIHRDVKPQNIMLTKQGKLKLADFGAANYLVQNQQRKTFIGTPQYMAPQLLYENQQSTAVDIWAVGVILYELTTMKLPFTAKTTAKIYQNIKNIKYEFPVCIQRDHELKGLIKSILVSNPKERPNAKDIMNHNWIQKNLDPKIAHKNKNLNPIQQSQQKHQQQISSSKLIQSLVQAKILKQDKIIDKQSSKITQIQMQTKSQDKQKPIKQQRCDEQKYIMQIQRKIALIQTKIAVCKKFKDKKQKIIQSNKIHMQELQLQIDNYGEFKQELQNIQNQIKNGDTRYFAALEERTKLKAYQFKLKQQISKYKVLKRKNSISNQKIKDQKINNIVTVSTISSNRVLSEEKQRHQSPVKRCMPPLQKSLSFSILQIQTLLSQIRQKKQRISSRESSTNRGV